MYKYFWTVAIVLFAATVWGKGKSTSAKKINWLTFQEVETLMKNQPKKVLVDVYTDWCGWCKVMDQKTYSNDSLIDYLNANFYAIKFDAESKKEIVFLGKTFKFVNQGRRGYNELAAELLNGQMSYPSTIIMEENFAQPQIIPGFIELAQMESILKFIGNNQHKSQSFNDWNAKFSSAWAKK